MTRLRAACLLLGLASLALAGPDETDEGPKAPGSDNLALAVKALGQSNWKEARLEALAALELMGDSAQALGVLSEAEEKLGRPDAAVVASWKLLKLPPGKETVPARARIRRLAAPLSGYLDARDKAAAELGALKKKAEQQGRKVDADRIQGRIDAIACGGEVGDARKGWTRISDHALWRWGEKPSDIKIKGDTMSFSAREGNNMSKHILENPGMARDAGLRFSLKFAGEIPNLFILFSGKGDPSAMDYALLLDASGGRIGFAWYDRQRGWRIKENEEILKGSLKPGVFQSYEVSYASRTRRMRVTVDQSNLFDQVLGGDFEFGAGWGIGYGTPTKYEIREVWIKDEPDKPASP